MTLGGHPEWGEVCPALGAPTPGVPLPLTVAPPPPGPAGDGSYLAESLVPLAVGTADVTKTPPSDP